MNSFDMDNAILAVTQTSWRKVAMIIAKAADKLGAELPEGDDGYFMIAHRIERLVRNGYLLAQGDMTSWRHSEIRLPKRKRRTTSVANRRPAGQFGSVGFLHAPPAGGRLLDIPKTR